MTVANEKTTNDPNAQVQAPILIHRLYIKDFSFEAPGTPQIFTEKWEPKMQLDIHVENSKVDDQAYEVILNLRVTVQSSQDKVAFIIELKYAGLFGLRNIPDAQLKPVLGIFCPSVLYPYAREVITDAVSRASFPQLILAPINFEALYAQQSQENPPGERGISSASDNMAENTDTSDR